jgi:hypothetical protein
VAVNPSVQFLGPLFGIHCSSGYELRFQSLPNSRKANINNVVRVTDDASLNRLPDYPFLLWI